MPVSGSYDPPGQWAPFGTKSVPNLSPSPRAIGGVKIAPVRYCCAIRSASALIAGVMSLNLVELEPLAFERWRLRGKRLSRCVGLTGNSAGRHWPFFNRPDRFARDTIEHIYPSLFGRLRDRFDRAAIDGDVGQDRRAR